MFKRRSSNEENLQSVPQEKLTRIILPPAKHFKKAYQNLLYEKDFTHPKVFLLQLKGLEERILGHLAQMNQEEKEDEFLIKKDMNSKVILSKNNYFVKY